MFAGACEARGLGRVLQPLPPQQGIRVGVAPAEATIQLRRVGAAALAQDMRLIGVGRGAVIQPALKEQLKRIGVQHLRPFVTVIARGITAAE